MIALLIRTAVLVCFAVFSMRLMGKRQIGQLQPFELVIAIMIADLATTPMESLDMPLWRGMLPLMVTVVLQQVFSLLSLKSQRMRAILSGRPTVVIRRGRIDPKALSELCFNLNDLLEELRSEGYLSPSEVGTAIMETSGKLSVFPHGRSRPATPQDLGIETGYEGVPLTLVLDGQLQKSNLPLLEKDEAWLMEQLQLLGYQQTEHVLLCYVDTDGMMTVHPYADHAPKKRQALSQGEVKW